MGSRVVTLCSEVEESFSVPCLQTVRLALVFRLVWNDFNFSLPWRSCTAPCCPPPGPSRPGASAQLTTHRSHFLPIHGSLTWQIMTSAMTFTFSVFIFYLALLYAWVGGGVSKPGATQIPWSDVLMLQICSVEKVMQLNGVHRSTDRKVI